MRLDDGGNGYWSEGDRACHFREGTGACLVRGGEEIVVDLDGEPDPALIRLAVLGPALGIAMMQRGHFLLHASATAMSRGEAGTGGERAVAFLGVHGAGKSTLAGSLHTLGHPLITDDIVALDGPARDGSDPVVRIRPSFPQLKLWDDAARDLGLEPEALPRVHPDFDKWAWRLGSEEIEAALPLARIYVLAIGETDRVQIEPLPSAVAVEFVMRNWYGARFGKDCFAAMDRGEHFRRCIEIASAVPARRLTRPRVASGLADLASRVAIAIEADLD